MVIPIGITFKEWAATLIIDFPTDNIPHYTDVTDWRIWGNTVAQEVDFANNAAPGTTGFSDSMTWAMAVYKQMTDNA